MRGECASDAQAGRNGADRRGGSSLSRARTWSTPSTRVGTNATAMIPRPRPRLAGTRRFRSPARLGLRASPSYLSGEVVLRPGMEATVGFQARRLRTVSAPARPLRAPVMSDFGTPSYDSSARSRATEHVQTPATAAPFRAATTGAPAYTQTPIFSRFRQRKLISPIPSRRPAPTDETYLTRRGKPSPRADRAALRGL